MPIQGRVFKYGDDINTDDIIAAKYLISTDEKFLGSHCMETINPNFSQSVEVGDIIVAGKNFGCGSSREHAPLAIKGSGIRAVLAKSFAAIFFRNAINIGLPFLELKDIDRIQDKEILEIDLKNGIIKNISKDEVYQTSPFPEFLQQIISQGGLMHWIAKERIGR